METKLIEQKDNACTLACIAMLTGRTLEKVEDIYPEFDGEGTSSEDALVIIRRLGYQPIQYATPLIFPGRLYMIMVPSLNTPGMNHNIVVDWLDKDNRQIFDPQKGRNGKLFYSEDGSDLLAYSDVIELVIN